jgi:hypothetical protein
MLAASKYGKLRHFERFRITVANALQMYNNCKAKEKKGSSMLATKSTVMQFRMDPDFPWGQTPAFPCATFRPK